MSRAGSSAVSNAVKGLEPRAPELEIPRPMGAGVGAGFLHALREAAEVIDALHIALQGGGR